MKITALAGGVGGAKLAHGFSKILKLDEFTVIVNTGDDFRHLGLYISPDIDTVTYMLADVSNSATGWGRGDESFFTLNEIKNLKGPDWFTLGDKDLAYHLVRTDLAVKGYSLSKITELLASRLGVFNQIIPMTDDKVRTIIDTEEYGEISFQEYFVKYKFQPIVKHIRFDGIESARPAENAITAMKEADLIVICPSNPYLSINPIIQLNGINEILCNKFVVGVSPIIGSKAVKGPLGKLLREFGREVNAYSIAEMYQDFLDLFIIDTKDPEIKTPKLDSSIIIRREDILLPDIDKRKKLAEKIVNISREYI